MNQFFQAIPDVTLKTWVPDLKNILIEEDDAVMAIDGSQIIPKFMPRDDQGQIIFPDNFLEKINQALEVDKNIKNPIVNMITSPFGFPSDDMKNYRKYPNEVGQMRKKDQYELELSKFARKLKLIPGIQNLLNMQYQRIFGSVRDNQMKIGVHIRRSDLKTDVTILELDLVMEQISNQHIGQVIFVCSDDYQLQERYVKKYNFRSYQDPGKVENNLVGVQKGLVDLYLLACCQHIYGTKNSSFGYYSWILSDDEATYQIHS